jgi:hypothetical protein
MGFFSTKKRAIVATTAVPLLKADAAGVVKEATVNAILRGENTVEAIRDSIMNGYGANFKRAFNYARDHYTNGLPEGTLEYGEVDSNKVKLVLESIEGKSIRLQELYLESAEYEMYVRRYLLNSRKVDFSTLVVGSLSAAMQATINNRIANLQQQYTNAAASNNASVKALYEGTDTQTQTVTVYEVQGNNIFKVETTTKKVVTSTASVSPVVTISAVPTTTYGDYDVDASGGQLTGYDVNYSYSIAAAVKTTHNVSQTQNVATTITVARTQVNTSKQPIGETTETVTTQNSSSVLSHAQVADATVTLTGQMSESVNQTIDETKLLYYVEYVVRDSRGVDRTKAWIYDPRSNTYPVLALGSGATLTSEFYPIVPFRLANRDLTHEDYRDEETYKTSKKLLKYLGLSLDDIAENINENPSVGDIDNAYITFGVPIDTESKEGNKYLALFFDHMAGYSKYKKSHYDKALNPDPVWVDTSEKGNSSGYWEDGKQTLPPVNTVTIRDASLDLTLAYHYVEMSVHTGVKTKVKKVIKEIDIKTDGSISSTTYAGAIRAILGSATTYSRSTVTFYHQLDADTYKKIVVHGPVIINNIYKNKEVITDLADAMDEDNGSFIVPLHNPTLQKLTVLERADFYKVSVNLIFNSYDIVKTKWYQTGFFQFVVLVIGVIIAIVTYQPQFIAAAAAGTAAVLILIAQIAFQYLAMRELLEYAIEELGLGTVMIFVIAYSLYTADYSKMADALKAMPMVARLLTVVSAAGQVYGAYVSNEVNGISEELSGLQDYDKEFQKAVKAANELLDFSGIIDPMAFVEATRINLSETPSQFYLRTVHAGNVGEVAIQSITNFVPLMLQLPQPKL